MADQRPNLLWITTDQQRYDSMGCSGNPVAKTPTMDRLAEEGIRLDRCYVTNGLCMPSRASMMTGRYARSHGVWAVGVTLPEGERTVATEFRESGYATALIGKSHLGSHHFPYSADGPQEIESLHRNNGAPANVVDDFWKRWSGPYYGFEHVELVLQHANRAVGGGHYDAWLRQNHPEALNLLNPEEALQPPTGAMQSWKAAMPAELHYSSWIADRTISFVEQQKDNGPFFIWMSLPDPHHPFAPPAPYCDMYQSAEVPAPLPNKGELDAMPPHHKLYYEGGVRDTPYLPGGPAGAFAADTPLKDMPEEHLREIIAHTYGLNTLNDDAIGRVLRYLDENGLAENTIILFSSDHGELLGDHGLLFKGPFYYESIIRVPCIIRWPRGLPSGEVYSGIVSSVDFMPTLLSAAGIKCPPGVQGLDLLATLSGNEGPVRREALIEHREHADGMQIKTLVTQRYKISYYPGHEFGELFDLQEDPQEYHNRWHSPEHAGVKHELLMQLLELLANTEDPLPERRCYS